MLSIFLFGQCDDYLKYTHPAFHVHQKSLHPPPCRGQPLPRVRKSFPPASKRLVGYEPPEAPPFGMDSAPPWASPFGRAFGASDSALLRNRRTPSGVLTLRACPFPPASLPAQTTTPLPCGNGDSFRMARPPGWTRPLPEPRPSGDPFGIVRFRSPAESSNPIGGSHPPSVPLPPGFAARPNDDAAPLRKRRFLSNGTPGGIRTPDLRIRSPALYPAELRARKGVYAPTGGGASQGVVDL